MKNIVSGIIAMINTINPIAALAIIAGKHVEISATLDWRHSLHRWNDNMVLIFENHKLIHNNLVERAWSFDNKEAKKEAAIAATYFLDETHNFNDLASLKFQIVDGEEVIDI